MKNFMTLMGLLLTLALGLGCSKDDEPQVREAEFEIASSYTKCNPSFNSTESNTCLTIKEAGTSSSYTVGDGTITGFSYEPGYRYRLRVKLTKLQNPPADGSDTHYELIQTLSKEKVD